jgi:hypothetical protein
MPFRPGEAQQELDRQFTEWLDTHVFSSPEAGGG